MGLLFAVPLLLLLMLVGVAESADIGSDEHWYHDAHEFAYIEVSMLLSMIPIAVIFDTLWYFISHNLESKAFVYDVDAAEGDGDARMRTHQPTHKQLSSILLQRMGTEFMTLGVLALTIFIASSQGLFDALVDIEVEIEVDESDFHLPTARADWFHMAEIVHFSLFLGMCLYFTLMTGFVWGAVREIRVWERIRRNDLKSRFTQPLPCVARMPTMLGNLPDEDQYRSMQQKFVDVLVRWSPHDEGFRNQLLEGCAMDQEGLHQDESFSEQNLRDQLEGRAFDFSSYLAFQLEGAVSDAVEVHSFSWCVVWVHLAITWPLHRLASLSMPMAVLLVMIPPALTWLAVCLVVFKMQQNAIAQRRIDRINSGRPPTAVGASFIAEGRNALLICLRGRRLMRIAQAICIICSYVLARLVFSPPDWTSNFTATIIVTGVVVLIWILLMLWLVFHAPIFIALMSLPPYFNPTNMKAMGNFLASFQRQPAAGIRSVLLNDVSCTTRQTARRLTVSWHAEESQHSYPVPDTALTENTAVSPVVESHRTALNVTEEASTSAAMASV